MKRRAAVVMLAFLTGATPTPATVADLPPADILYARELQRCNPSLNDATAVAYADATIEQADAYALDARLLVALIAVESAWNPAARSGAGALGLGQLMPPTAAALGVDAADPTANIAGAARRLRSLIDRFSTAKYNRRYELALAAYNAGAGAVFRYGGIPPYAETRLYVRRVMRLWRRLAGW